MRPLIGCILVSDVVVIYLNYVVNKHILKTYWPRPIGYKLTNEILSFS